MPSTAFDSFYLKDRYGSAAMRAIWDDRAMIQRWLDVEVALSAVQAGMGLIPKSAAREIAANQPGQVAPLLEGDGCQAGKRRSVGP